MDIAHNLEVVVFAGLQASGKTTLYRRRFAATHVHVSKDLMPSNRRKEARQRELIVAAVTAGRSVVVDNTNPTPAERVPLIEIAHQHGASATGYVFRTPVADALRRNQTRSGRARVSEVGILSTAKRLVPPGADEDFDDLFSVELSGGDFLVHVWRPRQL